MIKSLGSFDECVKNSNGELNYVSHNAEGKAAVDHNTELSNTSHINAEEVTKSEFVKEGETSNDQQETKFTGVVSKTTFIHYAKSMGGIWLVLGLLVCFAIAQLMHLSNTVVVGRWSELGAEDQVSLYVP